MFPQKTWYHPMVVAVILGGAVWHKSIFKHRLLKKIISFTNVKIRPEIVFFPKSRLGHMTYRKLKPHPSWHHLHAAFTLFHLVYEELENTWIFICICIFSLGCCLINTFNRSYVFEYSGTLDMWSRIVVWIWCTSTQTWRQATVEDAVFQQIQKSEPG